MWILESVPVTISSVKIRADVCPINYTHNIRSDSSQKAQDTAINVSPPRVGQSYFRQLCNICRQALWHNIDNRPADWLHSQRVSLNILQLSFSPLHGYWSILHMWHTHTCTSVSSTHIITDFDLSKYSQETKILIPTLSTIGCGCWLCMKSIVSKYAVNICGSLLKLER